MGDVVAGLSVGLVAIPQSLAYAELAGMPAQYGLYACALPSIVAAAFVSSRYLQTGAVALTALLTFGALSPLAEPQSHDYIRLAALLALLVGAFRVLLGVARLGRLAYLLSEPVLAGFTTGAALLIILSAFPKVVGASTDGDGVVEGFVAGFRNEWQVSSILFGITTATVILVGRRFHRLFPGVLVAVIGAIAVSLGVGYQGSTIGELDGGFISLETHFWWSKTGDLLLPAAAIALVGFAEPATIARTFAAKDRLPWNADREMFSQGVANVVAAVSGAFPVGGSFSRSALNRMAGATSPWAGAITGCLVLVALPVTPLLSPLPTAVLAAIVIVAVAKLVKVYELFLLFGQSKAQGLVALGTLAATIGFSPRVERGVVLGVGFSLLAHLYRELTVTVDHQSSDHVLVVAPRGVLWFATVPLVERLIRESLASCPELSTVIVDLVGVGRLDYTGAAALRRLVDEVSAGGVDVHLRNIGQGSIRAASIHLDCEASPTEP